MNESALLSMSGLEAQIDQLLESLEQLKLENYSLKQKLSASIRERAELQQKTTQVVTTIRKIITQLREEYHV